MHVTEAQSLLGQDLLTLKDVAIALGTKPEAFGPELRQAAAEIPLSTEDLRAARSTGQLVVFRVPSDGRKPLTINRIIERFASSFDSRLLRKVGYLLRDEWGIALEPLANTETSSPGWALVQKAILPDTANLSYYEQEQVLGNHALQQSRGAQLRRRSAVEAVYDLTLFHVCRGIRLLENGFDWTSSRTVDGGFLNVGGFTEAGIRVVGFSAAVRHAELGICPTVPIRQAGSS